MLKSSIYNPRKFIPNILPSGDIIVGNASNVATAVAMSGDAAISNTGAVTISTVGGKAISLANSFTTSGNFALTLTTTGVTNVTLPTSGTLVNTGVITLSSLTSIGNLISLTMAGNTTLGTNTTTGGYFKNPAYTNQTVAAASTTTIDYSAGASITLTQDTNITTMSFTNIPATGNLTVINIRRVKDNTGTARTIVWPAGTTWSLGVAPSLSTTANAVDTIMLTTVDGGTSYLGYLTGQAFA